MMGYVWALDSHMSHPHGDLAPGFTLMQICCAGICRMNQRMKGLSPHPPHSSISRRKNISIKKCKCRNDVFTDTHTGSELIVSTLDIDEYCIQMRRKKTATTDNDMEESLKTTFSA